MKVVKYALFHKTILLVFPGAACKLKCLCLRNIWRIPTKNQQTRRTLHLLFVKP